MFAPNRHPTLRAGTRSTRAFDARAQSEQLPQHVADALSTAIIEGTLEPGTKLNEEEVAAQFGISRTPVREALRQLASDGFVDMTPRKGATVSDVTARDAANIYVCRAWLQGLAARIAAESATPSDLSSIEDLLRQMELASRQQDIAAYFRLHVQMHDRVAKASRNPTLCSLIDKLGRSTLRYRFLSISYPGRLQQSFEFQREMVDALERRDSQRAELVVHKLIHAALVTLLRNRFELDVDSEFGPSAMELIASKLNGDDDLGTPNLGTANKQTLRTGE